MKNKKLFIALVALVAIVAIVLGVYFATRPATSEGGKAVTVTVVHKDGSEKVFTYHTDEEYLGTVLVDEGLVEGEQSNYGLYIKGRGRRDRRLQHRRQLLGLLSGRCLRRAGRGPDPHP